MTDKTFPGSDLRENREALDLTIEDVYRKLRIPVDVLRALEEGRVNDLPPKTFATGFLKSYCELLGLDGEGYAAALHDCTRKPTGIRSFAKQTKTQRPPWMNDALAWAVILVILALGWLTYTVTIQPEAGESGGTVRAETLLFEDGR